MLTITKIENRGYDYFTAVRLYRTFVNETAERDRIHCENRVNQGRRRTKALRRLGYGVGVSTGRKAPIAPLPGI